MADKHEKHLLRWSPEADIIRDDKDGKGVVASKAASSTVRRLLDLQVEKRNLRTRVEKSLVLPRREMSAASSRPVSGTAMATARRQPGAFSEFINYDRSTRLSVQPLSGATDQKDKESKSASHSGDKTASRRRFGAAAMGLGYESVNRADETLESFENKPVRRRQTGWHCGTAHRGRYDQKYDGRSTVFHQQRRSDNRITRYESPREKLQALLNEDPSQAVHALLSSRSGVAKLITSRNMNDTFLLELLIKVIRHACQSTYSPQSLSRLLQTVNESGFLSGPLHSYFVSKNTQLDASFVVAVASVIKSLLHHLPSSSLTNVTLVLSQLNVWLELNKDVMEDPLVAEARELVESADDMRKDVAKQIKGGDLVRDQELGNDTGAELPPDDFRKLPLIPTIAELNSEEPFLRKNIVYGSYQNVDHYLDVQYRLLREDFICPLRDGLKTLREYIGKNMPLGRLADIRFYRNVQILIPFCTQKCVMYRTHFDVTQFKRVRWESSKRLIFGSLVGLSKDNFESIIFGTVADRNPDDLKKGIVDLCFEESSSYLLDPNPYTVYQMIECSAYFEAYRHVLQGLQEISPGTLPFEKYILNRHSTVESVSSPRYLRGKHVLYNFSCLLKEDTYESWSDVRLLDLKAWPSCETLGLDTSQYNALQTAMTKEFVTIQGPPGTGKTFIGLKIVQLLLQNSTYWDADQSPILIVCYTNHALDQFLEGIIDTCRLEPGELVRVGGRSSSENKTLLACSTFEVKKQKRVRSSVDTQDAISETRERLKQIQAELTKLVGETQWALQSVIHEQFLQHHMTEVQCNTFFSRPFAPGALSLMPEWLRLNDLQSSLDEADVNVLHDENEQQEKEVIEDDEDDVKRLQEERQVEETGLTAQRQQHLKTIDDAAQQCQEQFDLYYQTEEATTGPWSQTKKKKYRKRLADMSQRLAQTDTMSELEYLATTNVWRLALPDRWRLYKYWASCFCDEKSFLVKQLSAEYNRETSYLSELKSEVDFQVLKEARVVGMTTTGAAKYRIVLQGIHPKIVIVEEAAEVMESHVARP